jgi:hypothetical protein
MLGHEPDGRVAVDRRDERTVAGKMCACEGRMERVRPRSALAWSSLLTAATATAVLMSGLNGFVQIMKVAIECCYAHR